MIKPWRDCFNVSVRETVEWFKTLGRRVRYRGRRQWNVPCTTSVGARG